MKKQNGFILVFTLCLIVLISLLVLSSMNNLMLYQHAMTQHEIDHQNVYQLERITHQLIKLPKHQLKSCMYLQDLANHTIKELIKKEGCQLTTQKVPYRYLVEDLGIYPCLITVKDNLVYSTHHFRFTVLKSETEESNSILMQLRVIQSTKLKTCNASIHYIKVGISSWRYLSLSN